jgi:hypothetical protein
MDAHSKEGQESIHELLLLSRRAMLGDIFERAWPVVQLDHTLWQHHRHVDDDPFLTRKRAHLKWRVFWVF